VGCLGQREEAAGDSLAFVPVFSYGLTRDVEIAVRVEGGDLSLPV
jgi:hypothetical protein